MVGGRYSVFTAVGLLPAAVMGIDIDQLLAVLQFQIPGRIDELDLAINDEGNPVT